MNKCKCRIVEKWDQREPWSEIEYCTLHATAEELFNEVSKFIDCHRESLRVDLAEVIKVMNKVQQETHYI